MLSNGMVLSVAYGSNIGNEVDSPFDGEIRANLNWYFGGSARQMLGGLAGL